MVKSSPRGKVLAQKPRYDHARCLSWRLNTQKARDHTNRAGRKAVRNWQYRLNRFVPCLEGAELTVLIQDEAFFMHDVITGRKYWALRDRWISVSYIGSHRRIVAYGAIAKDGRQFFRTH